MGRLQFIKRFISQHAEKCKPFYNLLKKDVPYSWNQECQEAFDLIKRYLLAPPILIAPVEGRPLLLYITVLPDSIGVTLAQKDPESNREHAIYYLSRTFVEYEVNYSHIKKTGLALV